MRRRASLAAVAALATIACAPAGHRLEIEMRSAEDRRHLVRGWSGFEGADTPKPFHFCWIEGRSAKVGIGRQPRTGTAHLTIRAWPFATASLPPQHVRLWVNSMFIGREEMSPEIADYSWRFPARLFHQWDNDLYLVFDRAVKPSDVMPGNTDKRDLAAAVERISLSIE